MAAGKFAAFTKVCFVLFFVFLSSFSVGEHVVRLWFGKLREKRRKRRKKTHTHKKNQHNYDESYSQTGKSSTAKRCGAKTKTTAATKPAFVCAVWLFHHPLPPFFL